MIQDIFDRVVLDLTDQDPSSKRIIHLGVSTLLDKTKFVLIPSSTDLRTISFIDGGNAPILTTPIHHCHLCRVASVTFIGKTRKDGRRTTFCLLARAGEDTIHIKAYGMHLDLPEISLHDNELRMGKHAVSPPTALALARGIAERSFAATLAPTLKPGSIIVLDGNLAPGTHPALKETLNNLIALCKTYNHTLIACSKTTTAITDAGESAPCALQRLALPGILSFPLEAEEGIYRTFARLHPLSRYWFLLESPRPIELSTMSHLAMASSDMAFPGYPYGLIVADQLARVSNQEQATASLILTSKAYTKDRSVSHAISGSNAHEILDQMQY